MKKYKNISKLDKLIQKYDNQNLDMSDTNIAKNELNYTNQNKNTEKEPIVISGDNSTSDFSNSQSQNKEEAYNLISENESNKIKIDNLTKEFNNFKISNDDKNNKIKELAKAQVELNYLKDSINEQKNVNKDLENKIVKLNELKDYNNINKDNMKFNDLENHYLEQKKINDSLKHKLGSFENNLYNNDQGILRSELRKLEDTQELRFRNLEQKLESILQQNARNNSQADIINEINKARNQNYPLNSFSQSSPSNNYDNVNNLVSQEIEYLRRENKDLRDFLIEKNRFNKDLKSSINTKLNLLNDSQKELKNNFNKKQLDYLDELAQEIQTLNKETQEINAIISDKLNNQSSDTNINRKQVNSFSNDSLRNNDFYNTVETKKYYPNKDLVNHTNTFSNSNQNINNVSNNTINTKQNNTLDQKNKDLNENNNFNINNTEKINNDISKKQDYINNKTEIQMLEEELAKLDKDFSTEELKWEMDNLENQYNSQKKNKDKKKNKKVKEPKVKEPKSKKNKNGHLFNKKNKYNDLLTK